MALNKMLVGILSVFIAIVVCAGVLAPAINMATDGSLVIEQSNTSFTGIRLLKQTSDFSLDMSVTYDDQDNIIIQNGSDTQTVAYGSMFLMAADNAAIYVEDDGPIAIWQSGGDESAIALYDDFTVQIGESSIEIVDNNDTYTLPLPTSYLFVPSSTGYYSSFLTGGIDKLAADPVIAISEVFAHTIAYNAISVGFDLDEQITGTTTFTDNVSWGAAVPVVDLQNFDPNQIQFNPINIDPLNPGNNQIMTVPTPTYTDGDWGYELDGDAAIIVSYSGSAASVITIPSTVGGYDVVKVGKGGSNQNVFDTSLASFSLVISPGITTIDSYAFRTVQITSISIPDTVTTINNGVFTQTPLTSVVMPDSVTHMGSSVFSNCTSLTYVKLSANVDQIGGSAFYNCSSLTNLVIPSTVTTIGSQYSVAFEDSGLTEVLNLSDVPLSPGEQGLSNDAVVKEKLDAVCYLGHLTEREEGNKAFNGILAAIPVVVIVAILLATATMMVLRRQ